MFLNLSFLETLFTNLSKYEYQRNVTLYNVADLNDWGKEGKPQGLREFRDGDVHDFGKIAKKYNLTKWPLPMYNVQFQQLTNGLNAVLKLTLKHKVKVEQTDSYIFIKGTFISLKNIKNHIDIDGFFGKTEAEWKTRRVIVVMASHVVFIDDDIATKGDSIAILAPKWEIIGSNRTISLDGANATDYHQTNKKRKFIYGDTGLPGRPGKPAGSFFGLGYEFVNGKNLTISAVGGKGSAGMSGADGEDGTDGASATVPSPGSRCQPDLCTNGKRINNFVCKKKHCTTSTVPLYSHSNFMYFHTECVYQLNGKEGRPGKKGGDGGRGGLGGPAGTVIFTGPAQVSGVNVLIKAGEPGKNGRGGVGGVNGKSGQSIVVSCSPSTNKWKLLQALPSAFPAMKNYKNGTEGANNDSLEVSEQRRSGAIKIPEIVTEFKDSLFERINGFNSYPDPFPSIEDTLKKRLLELCKLLTESDLVRDSYRMIDFIDELHVLEQHYIEKKLQGISLDFFYESLLERLKNYKLKDTENSIEYEQIKNDLITAVVQRLNKLDVSTSGVITNMREYANKIKSDMGDLKKMFYQWNKVESIRARKQKIQDQFLDKIEETKELIKTNVERELHEIDNQLDHDVEALIKEVSHLKNKNVKVQNILDNKRQQLEDIAKSRILFGAVKTMSAVVSFLGPIGTTVGMIAGSTSSQLELLASPQSGSSTLLRLPRVMELDFKRISNQFIELQKYKERKKIDHYHESLKDFSQKVDSHRELGDLSKAVHDAKSKLEQDLKPKTFKELRNQLTGKLEAKKGELNTGDNKEAIAIIKKFEHSSILSSEILDMCDRFKKNQEGLNEINKVIEQNYHEFAQLEEYEEKLHDTVIPVFGRIHNYLHRERMKLDNQSKSKLNVTLYNVKKKLEELEYRVGQLTKGLRARDDLMNCLKNLKHVMDILIKLYENILSTQNDQNLVEFITDINTGFASDMRIVDKEILEKLNILEITSRCNHVIERYRFALETFRKMVFPFGDTFIRGLGGPLSRNYTLNSYLYPEDIAHEIMHETDFFLQKLDDYYLFVRRADLFGQGEFTSEHQSTQPFFTWRNQDLKKPHNKILDLLSGCRVKLGSFINDSSMDAIKFNSVSLHFKVANQTRQNELNEILKSFKINYDRFGDSLFWIGKKYYSLRFSRVSFWHSFEKLPNGEPVHKGGLYNFDKGDFLLSPYGSWAIKLEKINTDNNVTFNDLIKFENEIDLELRGHAQYLIKGQVNETLANFYHKEEVTKKEFELMLSIQKHGSIDWVIFDDDAHDPYEYSYENCPESSGMKKREVTQNSESPSGEFGLKKSHEEGVRKKSNSWLSWLDFDILGGVDGAVRKGLNFIEYYRRYVRKNVSDNYFQREERDEKTMYLDKIESYTYAENHQPRIEFENIYDCNNNGMAAYINPGVNTLPLAQLFIMKKLGINSRCTKFKTLEDEKCIRIHELSRKIAPILKDPPSFTKNLNNFTDYCNTTAAWYQNLNKNN